MPLRALKRIEHMEKFTFTFHFVFEVDEDFPPLDQNVKLDFIVYHTEPLELKVVRAQIVSNGIYGGMNPMKLVAHDKAEEMREKLHDIAIEKYLNNEAKNV